MKSLIVFSAAALIFSTASGALEQTEAQQISGEPFPDDDKTLAVLNELTLINKDGIANSTALKRMLRPFYDDEDQLNTVVTKCGQRKEETPEDAASALLKCIRNDVFVTMAPIREGYTKAHEECLAQPGSSFKKETFKDEEPGSELGKHFFCVYKKVGVQDEDGKINSSAVRKLLQYFTLDAGQLDEAVHTCAANTDQTPETDAMILSICISRMVKELMS